MTYRNYKKSTIVSPEAHLLRVTRQGLSLPRIKNLLDAGADPNYISTEGETPLLNAIKRGHNDTVELLIEYGADTQSDPRVRVLAERLGNPEIISLVIGQNKQSQRATSTNTRMLKFSEQLYNLREFCKANDDYRPKYDILKNLLPAKFTMADLEAAISKLEDSLKVEEGEEKFEYGFDVWEGGQKFLRDKPNLVIQLNLKPAYMNKIYSKMGAGFKEWYLKLAKTTMGGGHPVFPIPGHTIGWARIHELEKDTWLINEIQEDWGTIKWTAHQLAAGKIDSVVDGTGTRHPISQELKDLLTAPEHLDWLEYVTNDLLIDFEKIILRAILDLAREHGVKHMYMLPESVQEHLKGVTKREYIYTKLPKMFHFNKVKVDMHEKYNVDSGYKKPEYYWYRNAQRAKIAMQKQAEAKKAAFDHKDVTVAVSSLYAKIDALSSECSKMVNELESLMQDNRENHKDLSNDLYKILDTYKAHVSSFNKNALQAMMDKCRQVLQDVKKHKKQ